MKMAELANDAGKALHPDLRAFLQKARSALKQRIDMTHDEIKLETEPAKVLWTWAVALGAMAYDMSGSSQLLLENNNVRGAVVLNRCIFEYWLRLSFYAKHHTVAERDLNLIENRFRKILKADPTTFRQRTFSAETIVELRKFLNEDGGKAPQEKVREMLDKTFSKPVAEALYEKYYALASIPAHGNELIMLDVFRDFTEGVAEPKVDYQSRRFNVMDTGGVLGHLVLNMLEVIEDSFARVPVFKQLQVEFNRLQGSLGLLT